MSKKNIIVLSGGALLLSVIGALFFFNIVFKSNDAKLNNEIQLGDDHCFSDANCDEGYICVDNHCGKKVGGPECVSHSECRSGKRCYKTHCVPQCTDISDSSQCSSTGCYWDSSTGKCLKNRPATTPTPSLTPKPTNTASPTQQPAPVTCSSITNGSACFNAGCYWDYSKSECLNLKPSFTPIPTTQSTVTSNPTLSDYKCYCSTLIPDECDWFNSNPGSMYVLRKDEKCSNIRKPGASTPTPSLTNTPEVTKSPEPDYSNGCCLITSAGKSTFTLPAYCKAYAQQGLTVTEGPCPTSTPAVTQNPNPTLSALLEPQIVCANPIYDGYLQRIAECKNGKFVDGYRHVFARDVGSYDLICIGDNGKQIKATCEMKKNSSDPVITCVNSVYNGIFDYKVIAECSNGIFAGAVSGGYDFYTTSIPGNHTVTCYGYDGASKTGKTTTKTCRLYQSQEELANVLSGVTDASDLSDYKCYCSTLVPDECDWFPSNPGSMYVLRKDEKCSNIRKPGIANASYFIYKEQTTFSQNVPDNCQYLDENSVVPEASESSADRVCQYTVSDDTSKCDGSDSCYRVVEYVKEKNSSDDNNSLKMAIFIALSGIIVASVVYAYITYVRKK